MIFPHAHNCSERAEHHRTTRKSRDPQGLVRLNWGHSNLTLTSNVQGTQLLALQPLSLTSRHLGITLDDGGISPPPGHTPPSVHPDLCTWPLSTWHSPSLLCLANSYSASDCRLRGHFSAAGLSHRLPGSELCPTWSLTHGTAHSDPLLQWEAGRPQFCFAALGWVEGGNSA